MRGGQCGNRRGGKRRTIATLAAVALAIGVALVAGTGPAPPAARRFEGQRPGGRLPGPPRRGDGGLPARQRRSPTRSQPVRAPDPPGAGGPQQPAQPRPAPARPGRPRAGDQPIDPRCRTGVGELHRRRHLRQPHPGHLCPCSRRARPLPGKWRPRCASGWPRPIRRCGPAPARPAGASACAWSPTATCQLDIARVTLTPTGDDTFSQMRTELVAQGYDPQRP